MTTYASVPKPSGHPSGRLAHVRAQSAQLGMAERLAGCRTVWLCASCFACSARCPKGVKIAEVMEAVRVVLIRRGLAGPGPESVHSDEDGLPPIAIIGALRKLTF